MVIRLRLHRLCQLRCTGRLSPQVQLPIGPALEIGDGQRGPQPCRLPAHGFDMRSGPFIGFDIAHKFLFNARAQHFNRHIAPFHRHGAVHLRNGGSAHRIRFDRGKKLLYRAVQPRFNLCLNFFKRHWRQLVLQGQQVLRSLFTHNIGARCQCLAQLNRSRTNGAKSPCIIWFLGLDRAKACNTA